MSLYQELVKFIESEIRITQGRLAGELFVLAPWQKRFLRGMLSVGGDCALSVARANGKSTLIAALAQACLYGPLMEPNAKTVVCASSFEQGRVIFDEVLRQMDEKIEADPKRWRLQDSSNRASITDRTTGASVRCIGSDPKRMHGLQPRLVIGDELAQWEPAKIERSLAALETSMGKIPDSRAIWIGTRPDSPEHPFERFLNGGCSYSQVHAADADDPPFQQRTWRKANPSLRFMPDLLARLREEARRAKQDPAVLASFKALRLNMGVSDTVENVLLSADVWREIETETPPVGQQYVLGLDLGQSAAMSAAAAFWWDSGGLDAFAVLPEQPHLLDRGRADGVDRLYVECWNRGELILAGLKVSSIDELLEETLRRWGEPAAIVCDTWRLEPLREELAKSEYPRCPVVVRRMGFFDGGNDVREFRIACLDGHVRPATSLLMRSAMSGARVVGDPAGNWKLAKGGQGRKPRARDDAVAAAILAVAEGRRIAKREARRRPFRYTVIPPN